MITKIGKYINIIVDKLKVKIYDIYHNLRAEYQYSFASEGDIKNMKKLIKMTAAKHEKGMKKPSQKMINKVSDAILPEREVD